ncbi:hypothetical protein NKW45_05690 [Acetobacter orientalis]|uniref:hypothetical protein n=1 Tax=Acetobacter orientalis TaxID=146474 RepID=UPI0020A52828|nr:hypothetical protein [Acetobacter orientalis]MCP1221338.1 hypothetical protein [Acetobacter orientalis]
MQFRRSTALPKPSEMPTEAIRLTRWWRGYQRGQVARFPVQTAAELKQKGWAQAYKPTAEEAHDDAIRVQIQEEGLAQDRAMRNASIASQSAAASTSRATARR